MSIQWSSIDVIDPLMDETIIVKKGCHTELKQLDSRHGIEFWVVELIAEGFTLWSDTE